MNIEKAADQRAAAEHDSVLDCGPFVRSFPDSINAMRASSAKTATRLGGVEAVSAADVRPLRHRVLRAGMPAEAAVFANDDSSIHLAVRDERGEVVAVASVHEEAMPSDPRDGDWRLRGMAVDPAWQGTGVGSKLLAACVERVAIEGGRRLWCNARTPAERFYARGGFATLSPVFDIPTAGPHVVMARDIAAAHPSDGR